MITVLAAWDGEAKRWIGVADSIGVAIEAESMEALMERLEEAVPTLSELNGKGAQPFQVVFSGLTALRQTDGAWDVELLGNDERYVKVVPEKDL